MKSSIASIIALAIYPAIANSAEPFAAAQLKLEAPSPVALSPLLTGVYVPLPIGPVVVNYGSFVKRATKSDDESRARLLDVPGPEYRKQRSSVRSNERGS